MKATDKQQTQSAFFNRCSSSQVITALALFGLSLNASADLITLTFDVNVTHRYENTLNSNQTGQSWQYDYGYTGQTFSHTLQIDSTVISSSLYDSEPNYRSSSTNFGYSNGVDTPLTNEVLSSVNFSNSLHPDHYTYVSMNRDERNNNSYGRTYTNINSNKSQSSSITSQGIYYQDTVQYYRRFYNSDSSSPTTLEEVATLTSEDLANHLIDLMNNNATFAFDEYAQDYSYSRLGDSSPYTYTYSDVSGLRYQGQATLTSVSAVPIPAALPLFGSALGMLGFMSYRRRKNKSTQ